MYRQWVKASHLIQAANSGDPWSVDYSGHPLLDPGFVTRPTRTGRFFQLTYRRIRHDDMAYRAVVSRMMDPARGLRADQHGPEDLASYLSESDSYIDDIITLLPSHSRDRVKPLPQVTACNDLRTLLSLLLSRKDTRLRFEVQRKLYLAKLLLDIDRCRHVQDGPAHKNYFERLINDGMWKYSRGIKCVEIGFEVDDDGETIRYNPDPRPGQQRWEFNCTPVCRMIDDRKIVLDVLYYNCRFKRSVTPISYEIVDGNHHVVERRRWGAMRSQSSGSILSKMIRKGISSPEGISDLLGAMFIVRDNEAMNDLLVILDAVLGNPIGWRNVTDTLDPTPWGSKLNKHSGQGYRVFKGDIDLLYPDPDPNRAPYRFQVEVQVYTLEGFLRTVHGDHDASHLAMKLRQFLHGLVPIVFPQSIYGDDWLNLNALLGPPRREDGSIS